MSKLCLGGAFNPIHHGHLLCARAAAEALGIETVLLIPTHEPPHKKLQRDSADSDIAAADHRLTMCRLAVAGVDGFQVDDRELRRPGPSYTIDTLRELNREGWSKIPWLIGADQVIKLHTWREPHELLKAADFVVLARPGFELDWQAMAPEYRFLAERVVAAPAIDISGTEIRRRVAEGRPIDFLTPPAVCRYIKENGLYRSSRI
jgi:nicotinate-nucleotide adenylyltransferase